MTNNNSKVYADAAYTVANGNFPHGVLVECENEDEGLHFAHFLAQCLVCRGKNVPCGGCSDCLKAQKNGHPDIYETDGMKGRGKGFTVDAVREVRSDAFIMPNESDKKIYILKNGQNMNEQAQNALLKILEEPPSYVFFIIITTSRSAMLETVLSRVTVYSLYGGVTEISEKESEAVKGMISALLCVDELKLMEQTAVFQKNSQFARTVLELMLCVFRDALVQKSGFSRDFLFPSEVSALCSTLTAKSLLQLSAVCDALLESIDRNCNNNLLTVRMCYEFKRAMGR